MIKEAIEKIIALSAPAINTMDGRFYSDKTLVPIKPPHATNFNIHTLTGIIDWLKTRDNSAVNSNIIVQVLDHSKVHVFSELEKPWLNRHFFIETALISDVFQFGRYMSIEDFIIQFQCKFVESEIKNKIIEYLSSITVSEITTSEDNGLAQEIVRKNKIGRLEKITIDPMVYLKPFRTFLEVEQPESLFLLRLQKTDKQPMVALFEADGGFWKLEAITKISEYLRSKIEEATLDIEVNVIS